MKSTILVVAVIVSIMAVAMIVQVNADKPSADDKADSQSQKGHVKQADRTCEKAGFNGYLGENGNGDCGFLN